MVFFTRSSLMITLSGSASFSLHVSLAVMDTGCSISLPLLRVILLHGPLLDLAMFGKGTFLSPVPPEYC